MLGRPRLWFTLALDLDRASCLCLLCVASPRPRGGHREAGEAGTSAFQLLTCARRSWTQNPRGGSQGRRGPLPRPVPRTRICRGHCVWPSFCPQGSEAGLGGITTPEASRGGSEDERPTRPGWEWSLLHGGWGGRRAFCQDPHFSGQPGAPSHLKAPGIWSGPHQP